MTCILRNIFSSTTIPAFVHEGLIALLKSSVFGFSLGSGSAGLGTDTMLGIPDMVTDTMFDVPIRNVQRETFNSQLSTG